jgi:hypothetical protein
MQKIVFGVSAATRASWIRQLIGSNDGESQVANAPNAEEAEYFCTEILLRCINVFTCTDGAALMNEVLDCVEAWLNVGQFCPLPRSSL